MLLLIMRWLAFFVSASLIVIYFQGGTLIVKDTRRAVHAQGARQYLYFVLVMGAGGLCILATQLLICLGYLERYLLIRSGAVGTAGAVLLIAGIGSAYGIRYAYLRGNWSGNVEIKEHHRVVTEGPYRCVRHPIYALTLLIYPGAALAFPVWWNILACGVMIAGYVWLTAYEDSFLQHRLPGYRAYAQRTKHKLIPGVW
jgi:protein-S-isoprenylcysteine O-methyltransferase Ste14